MSRTSNLELPSASELWEILEKESQRLSVRYDFVDLHPEIFVPFRSVCNAYGVDCAWIDTYQTCNLDELTNRINHTIDQLTELIVSQPLDANSFTDIYDTLDTSTEPSKADAIFVFGAPSNLRIQKAIELYKAGCSDHLILSGHGPHYGSHSVTEAKRMFEYAVAEGVPASHITIEDKSVTIPDNVKRTLDLFEHTDTWPRKLIIVASPFVLRRSEMEWFKFSPKPIEMVPVSSDILSPELSREGWSKSEHGIRVVLNEFAKIVLESKMDLLRVRGEV